MWCGYQSLYRVRGVVGPSTNASLTRGQVPSRDVLKTVFGVDFIYENTRYSFTATRSSRTTWTLYLNGGHTSVGARPLADGGLPCTP